MTRVNQRPRARNLVSGLAILVIAAAAVLSAAACVRAILSYNPGYSTLWLVFFGLVPGALAVLLAAALRLDSASRVAVGLTIVSVVVAVYGVELYLWRRARNAPQASAKSSGAAFDARSPDEVVAALRAQGRDAFVAARQVTGSGPDLLPLGGISGKTIVLCRESGLYAIYESDEHGFSNPRGIWDSDSVDIGIVGDSFTHGACVPPEQSMVGHIRASYPATLNVGHSANGPLYMLASIREYLSSVQPKHVLWVYYEGNDLDDLNDEKGKPVLRSYLRDDYRQGLLQRQAEIDARIIDFLNARSEGGLPTAPQAPASGANRMLEGIKAHLGLHYIKIAFGLARDSRPGEEYDFELFREVLSAADQTVASWGGSLYFVYLPSWGRYQNSIYPRLYPGVDTRARVLELVESLGMPVIDVHPAFMAHQNPSELFAFPNAGGHYSPLGHRISAEAILHGLGATSIARSGAPSP